MVTNAQKSLLRFALVGGVLAMLLASCGKGDYESVEECRLEELKKVSRSEKEAIAIVINYCDEWERKNEKRSKSKKSIADPNWRNIGPEGGYSDGSRFLVDVNSIEIDDFRRTFWKKELDPGQTVDGPNYTVYRMEADCSSGTINEVSSFEVVNMLYGSEQFGTGSTTVHPGTNQADIYQFVCEKK
jgi:hypothetical protein